MFGPASQKGKGTNSLPLTALVAVPVEKYQWQTVAETPALDKMAAAARHISTNSNPAICAAATAIVSVVSASSSHRQREGQQQQHIVGAATEAILEGIASAHTHDISSNGGGNP